MAVCCGKERTTNFCPNCGKAMSPEAGILGLKRYLESQLEKATKKEKESKAEAERAEKVFRNASSPNQEYYDRRWGESKKILASATKKREQWQNWIESLIRLVDGE